MPGKVFFANGESVNCSINVSDKAIEGSLLLKKNGRIISYSPLEVNSFLVYDTIANDTLVYESISVNLHNGGIKKLFLEQLFQGTKYSLYKNVQPLEYINSSTDSLKAAKEKLINLFSVDRRAIFFVKKIEIAFHISLPKGDPHERKFKVEKTILLDVLEVDRSILKRFIKENNLNPIRHYDIKMLVIYADSLNTYSD